MTIPKNMLMRFKMYTQVKLSENMHRFIVSKALPELFMETFFFSFFFLLFFFFFPFNFSSSFQFIIDERQVSYTRMGDSNLRGRVI